MKLLLLILIREIKFYLFDFHHELCRHKSLCANRFKQGEFHPKHFTEPYGIVSHHTALPFILSLGNLSTNAIVSY